MFVPVSSLTRRALVETGEHRSPKRTPESIAPPVRMGFAPIVIPIVTQITPIVAAEPKDVPIRNETRQHRAKVIKIKDFGLIKSAV